ncbi:ATP-binding protein [Ponticoccus alexandrii]|uniref:ATP-binding protein n=1 Tax=Ponticoccus alexandrii TaxID=1943633 RepID=A0ABX7F4G5_9RHOB|nr:ATP-binding protein [Ponticoccus alexandrii]QRF65418.1 ATP-binding protein [Ponticoccus alexandrii]
MITSAERSNDGILIRCVLDGTPDNVSDSLRKIRAEIERHAPGADEGLPWELVVAEVLNNIVEHAYRDRPAGRIIVCLAFCATGLCAVFTDYGCEMPGHRPPEGRVVELDRPPVALPEGGFGWFLIRSLTTDLRYHRVNGANHLSLTVPRSQDV